MGLGLRGLRIYTVGPDPTPRDLAMVWSNILSRRLLRLTTLAPVQDLHGWVDTEKMRRELVSISTACLVPPTFREVWEDAQCMTSSNVVIQNVLERVLRIFS